MSAGGAATTTAAAKKSRYILAKLYSMAGTGYMYHKRRLRMAPKLEMVKYDPLGKTYYNDDDGSSLIHPLYIYMSSAISCALHRKLSLHS